MQGSYREKLVGLVDFAADEGPYSLKHSANNYIELHLTICSSISPSSLQLI